MTMYTGSLPDQSNRADWQEAVILTDFETGELIDISLCSITMTVRDMEHQCVVLTGSTDAGDITLPEDGTFMWLFTTDRMAGLYPGPYEVGVRISQDDQVIQLIIGRVNIKEGIDTQ